MMKKILTVLALSLCASTASADNWDDDDDFRCEMHPKQERIAPNKVQQDLIKQGYQIRDFDYDDNCYQVEVINKQGERVDLYLDTKTAKVVGEENKGKRKVIRKQ